MATGGGHSSQVAEAAGSDAAFDHVCDPCSDEQTVGAVGFCVDCEEWLCQECFKTHKKPKPSRHHVLITEEEKKSTQKFQMVDKCSERCEQHGRKRIKYFCLEHTFLGCSTCIIESHGSCKAQNLSDLLRDAATQSELQQFETDLNDIVKQSKEIVDELSDKKNQVEQNKIKTVASFKKYQEDVIESLGKIEIALENKCNENEEREKKKLDQIADKCETIEKDSLFIQNQLHVFEDKGQLCNMFVVMTKSKSTVETFKDDLKHSEGSTGVTLYEFKPVLKASEILDCLEGIRPLVETRQLASKVDYSAIRFQHVTDISVKSDGNDTCRITGSVLIGDNKLVLVDNSSDEVKVVDLHQNILLSQIEIDGKPWGACKLNDNSIAVTLPDKHELLFLTVNVVGELSTLKTLFVGGRCLNVEAVDDRIVVSYSCSEKIEIMDTDGSVFQTFGYKIRDQVILSTPQHVSLSPDKKSVYVSNFSNDTVTCLRLDGTVTAIYKDDEMKRPEQMSVDSSGMLYVGAWASNNVHLITPDCKKVKVVLCESDGLQQVISLCYCEKSNRLFIGMDSCDVIKVFQLT